MSARSLVGPICNHCPLVGCSLTKLLPNLMQWQPAPLAATPLFCAEPMLAHDACLGPAEANAQLSGILLKVVENKPGLHHLLVSSAGGTCGMPGSTRLRTTTACTCTCTLAQVYSVPAA